MKLKKEENNLFAFILSSVSNQEFLKIIEKQVVTAKDNCLVRATFFFYHLRYGTVLVEI
jgi:hypothetical protein